MAFVPQAGLGVGSILCGGGWLPQRNLVVAVLQGFFDDSGTHGSAIHVTLAGYVALEEDWRRFESDSKIIFDDFKVNTFHAKHFVRSNKDFDGWTSERQMQFATRWMTAAKKNNLSGAALTIPKKSVTRLKGSHKHFAGVSALSQCARSLIAMLLDHEEFRKRVETHGFAFFVESGNKNNGSVLNAVKQCMIDYGLEDRLLQSGEVSKLIGPTVQIADYLAYFSNKVVHSRKPREQPLLGVAVIQGPSIIGSVCSDLIANPHYRPVRPRASD